MVLAVLHVGRGKCNLGLGMPGNLGEALIEAARVLARAVDNMRFAKPVHWTYNPLLYARIPHELYLARYAASGKRAVFLGMNPGPWGMAQTGVPFGEVAAVREWLGIVGAVATPKRQHARIPVTGFECRRSEVSGRRLWGLMRERFGSGEQFSHHAFVANYCPLLFLDEAGRNLTPDKITRNDKTRLYSLCDRFLTVLIETLRPEWLVGVGVFAEQRIRAVMQTLPAAAARVVCIPHPSPANPRANRDWASQARAVLESNGVW
jgi:single-strand selective monofunctional uracil DNA glycosylase